MSEVKNGWWYVLRTDAMEPYVIAYFKYSAEARMFATICNVQTSGLYAALRYVEVMHAPTQEGH